MPMGYHGGGRGGRGGPQGGRGNNAPPNAYVVGMPPPQMSYYNPYAQHMPPQYNPQVAGGRGGHGWSPSYPGAPVGNPYARGPQYYQGGPGRGGSGRGRGGRGGRGSGRGHSSFTPPAPRVKKALVITVCSYVSRCYDNTRA